MAGNIYTFSIKSEADRLLLERIKLECRRTGVSFSHVVMEAIKATRVVAK